VDNVYTAELYIAYAYRWTNLMFLRREVFVQFTERSLNLKT